MGMMYFKCFFDYFEAIEPLNDEERGRLFTALLVYGKTGEAPDLQGNERFLFPMMRAQIDRDRDAYDQEAERISEARREAGRKGGLAKASKSKQEQANLANASKSKQTVANLAEEKDKEKDKDKDKDIFRDFASGDGLLYDSLVEFERMRKKLKSPMTERAKELLCAKLKKLASDSAGMVALLNESIVHGWKDVYPLKQQGAKAPLVESPPGELELRMLRRLG